MATTNREIERDLMNPQPVRAAWVPRYGEVIHLTGFSGLKRELTVLSFSRSGTHGLNVTTQRHC